LTLLRFWQVKAVAEEMGIGFLGIGFQPKWALQDIPIMPKVIIGIVYAFGHCLNMYLRGKNL